MHTILLRPYRPADAAAINPLATSAFAQFKDAYTNWPVFKEKFSAMAALAAHGDIIVAEQQSRLVGAGAAWAGRWRKRASRAQGATARHSSRCIPAS